jgi:RHS repeat-associated protein
MRTTLIKILNRDGNPLLFMINSTLYRSVRSLSRFWHGSLLLLLFCAGSDGLRAAPPKFIASIFGSNPVTVGSTSTYVLFGSSFNATNWTISGCGTITSWNGLNATVQFSGTGCGTSTTLTAYYMSGALASITITVNPNPLTGGTISNPTQTVNYNTIPGQILASVASGGSCSGSYAYQWYSSTNGTSFTPMSGATSQNYQSGALTAPNNYFKRLTTCVTTVYTSNTATVTVYPQLISQTVGAGTQTINYNTAPSTLTATAATGGNGSYTYQWYSSPNGSAPWTAISGATALSYSSGNLTATCFFMIQVTSNGVTAASNIATVNVYPQLMTGNIAPLSQTINYNAVPGTLSVSGTSGGSGAFTYQWQSCATIGGTYAAVGGATSNSYTPGALTGTTYYEVVTTSNGASVTSNAVTITVYPQLVSGSISPSSQTINYNTLPSLAVSAATGGNGIYSYTWWSSPRSGGIYSQVGTGISYSPGALTTTMYYQVVSTSNGLTVTSSPVVVNVNLQVFPGIVTPSNLTITSGTSPGLLTANPASGGACSGAYSYQWQISTDAINFSTISGATGQNYTSGNLSLLTYYRRRAICGTDTEYTNICQITVGNVTTNPNYVRARTFLKPGIIDTGTAASLSSIYDVAQVTQYFDGLGRPLQTVSKQASPLQNDVVQEVVYDNYGREPSTFLPYTASSNDGNYKSNALADLNNFSTSQFPGETYYYGLTSYEASPLNRVLAAYAPGSNWIGAGRSVSNQYLTNTTSDSVQIWVVSGIPSIPTSSGAYAPGQLFKTVTTDEQNHQTIEYKDMAGQVVLKKSQLANTPGSAHVGWLCTYYVYDNNNNIRFVLQPRAVELVNGSWTINSPIANELCFRYEYDGKNRMFIKKIPGAGEVWMVFDARDRVVMSQDSSLRHLSKWMVTVYDSLNRPLKTGLLTDVNNQAYHQNLASFSVSYPNTVGSNFELLTQTYYDNYTWVSGTGTSLGSTIDASNTSNGSYFVTTYNTSPVYAQSILPDYRNRGIATGSMTKVIGSISQYLYNVNFFDDHARVIQTQNINYTGAKDEVTTQYDFSGKPLRDLFQHQKSGNTVQNHIVITKLNYDAGFRVKSIYKNIDAAASDQLIDSMQYNELGQLQAKYLGNKVDSLIYDYNIRGWITGINKNYVGGTTNHYFGMELGYDKAASIASTTTYLNLAFNGNIAGTVWKSAGDGVGRKYDYSYDNVNRLSLATFVQNTAGTTWDSATMNFTTSGLSYDANGNILSMNQNGFKVGVSAPIDQLLYTYQNNGVSNKLSLVTDGVNDQNSQLGDFHYNPTTKGAIDYSYDGNGNLRIDNNKSIDSISYNYLNLPQQVHMNGKGNILYTYDAGGNKLRKLTTDSASRHCTTTLYLGGFVYQQSDSIISPSGGVDTLQFMAHEEGRSRWAYHKYFSGTSGYAWEYDFFEKDHLGNTRVLLTQEKDTAQYMATMEAAYRSTENQLYYNIPASSYPRASIAAYPSDPTTPTNDSVARLNGNGQKVGPAIILKVMSGDTIDIAAKSYYTSQTGTGTNPSITDVLNSLANGIVNMTGGAKGTLSQLNSTGGPLYAALNSFISNKDGTLAGQPRAYLNWILLDNQFNYVNSYPQSGAIPVSNFAMGTLGTPGYSGIPITKSGYLYIYVSNETQGWDVFFDNLSVRQRTGPMLEENHYYPFGLSMAGISDKALKTQYAENKYRYNDGTELANKEFSDGSGLEMYETDARSYDPQLGRFWQIDPLGDINESYSPYSFANDNPILLNDPLGLLSDSTHPQELESVIVTPGNNSTGVSLAKTSDGAPTEITADAPPTTGSTPPIGGSSNSDNSTASQDKGDHTVVTDIAYELNKFNPLAKVVDLGYTIFTHHDSYDVPQNIPGAITNLAATIPAGRLSSAIVDVGLTEVRQGIAKTLSIPNDIYHILDSKHNLGILLSKAGSEANVIRRLYLSLGQAGSLPASGIFEKVVNIYGQDVTIRGAVVNGVPRISTAFIP